MTNRMTPELRQEIFNLGQLIERTSEALRAAKASGDHDRADRIALNLDAHCLDREKLLDKAYGEDRPRD